MEQARQAGKAADRGTIYSIGLGIALADRWPRGVLPKIPNGPW